MNPTSPIGANDWLQLAITFSTVLLLLGGGYLIFRYLKKGANPSSIKLMSIIEVLPIDSRQRLVLLRVRDKEVLLSMSPNGIERLGEWDHETTKMAASPNAAPQFSSSTSPVKEKASRIKNLLAPSSEPTLGDKKDRSLI
jgi:flagellar biogenesis protein FliO